MSALMRIASLPSLDRISGRVTIQVRVRVSSLSPAPRPSLDRTSVSDRVEVAVSSVS